MKNRHLFRQNCRIDPERGAEIKLRYTIAAVVGLLVLLAIGHHIDAEREAQDAEIEHSVRAAQQRREDERMWLARMSQAYAAGREDLLKARPTTPEAGMVLMACARLKGEGQ